MVWKESENLRKKLEPKWIHYKSSFLYILINDRRQFIFGKEEKIMSKNAWNEVLEKNRDLNEQLKKLNAEYAMQTVLLNFFKEGKIK